MSAVKKVLPFLFLAFYFSVTDGQQIPLSPISYRIFSPFIFNPAIAGSKDFFSVDLIAGSQAKLYSQIISGNARLLKKEPGYFLSPEVKKFTNVGFGGSVFNDLNGSSRNLGISFASAYHFPLNKKALSFLSVGISVKGIVNLYPGDTDLGIPEKSSLFPNLDMGLYYYDPNFFIGLSATNFFKTPWEPYSPGSYPIPVSRQYFLLAGCKFVISRSNNIVLEPSIMANTDDSLSKKISHLIEPALKVYIGNLCLGSYFRDYSQISFFFQFKYPRFYIGTFFELPKKTAFYKKEITAELAIGVNLSGNSLGFKRNSHW